MANEPLSLLTLLRNAMQQHIADCQETVVKEAVENFEKDLRRRIVDVSVEVANNFSMEQLGTEVLIRLKDVRLIDDRRYR